VGVTYALAVGFMALFALAFLTIPDALLGLYSHDPAILGLGRRLLLMAALFQIFDGAQVAGFSVLRGAADTRVPMFLAAIAYWVAGAPAAYLLGFHTPLGPVGVWAGLSLGLAVAAILLLRRVRVVLL
jgi:MATE family multidrug resistance protein